MGKCLYNIKITFRYVALLPFSIGFVITRMTHHRPDVGGGKMDKIATNFKCDF